MLTAFQVHLLSCYYSPFYEDFTILTTESNDLGLK